MTEHTIVPVWCGGQLAIADAKFDVDAAVNLRGGEDELGVVGGSCEN